MVSLGVCHLGTRKLLWQEKVRYTKHPAMVIAIKNFKNLIAIRYFPGAAGFWVSIDRIVTKYGFRSPQRSTFMFFVFSILILLGHTMLHHVMMRHPLVQHYLRLTNESRHKRRIQLHLNPNEDATLVRYYFSMIYILMINVYICVIRTLCIWKMESEAAESSYGVLKLQSPAVSANQGTYCN